MVTESESESSDGSESEDEDEEDDDMKPTGEGSTAPLDIRQEEYGGEITDADIKAFREFRALMAKHKSK